MSDTPRTDAMAKVFARASSFIYLCRELERENNKLRATLDNPHAVHAHYLRIGNGWEVWTTERVRGMERELETLRAQLAEAGCGVCGGKMVFVRGRYPGADKRKVCPTCLADRMDMIRELTSAEYGQAVDAARSATP